MPNRPVNEQGMRTEPPPSVPTASGPMPAATAAVAPPEEPPGVFAGSQGLRVIPVSGLSVTPFQPNSGVVVLPSSTAPCSRNRATAGASSFHGPFGSTVFEPRSVGQPFVSRMSLIETGTPSSRPLGSPRSHRVSDCFADSVESAATRLKALSAGFNSSMRFKTAFATSTGETACFLNSSTSSVADNAQRSVLVLSVMASVLEKPGAAERRRQRDAAMAPRLAHFQSGLRASCGEGVGILDGQGVAGDARRGRYVVEESGEAVAGADEDPAARGIQADAVVLGRRQQAGEARPARRGLRGIVGDDVDGGEAGDPGLMGEGFFGPKKLRRELLAVLDAPFRHFFRRHVEDV